MYEVTQQLFGVLVWHSGSLQTDFLRLDCVLGELGLLRRFAITPGAGPTGYTWIDMDTQIE